MLLTLETFMMNDCKKSTHRIWLSYTLNHKKNLFFFRKMKIVDPLIFGNYSKNDQISCTFDSAWARLTIFFNRDFLDVVLGPAPCGTVHFPQKIFFRKK